ncbi:MAG: hypothetical protein GY841_06650, partial [FCB group bacterium]|nr:hypothetical protein [FCB group bacterium]
MASKDSGIDVIDSTLREDEQAPGTVFTDEAKCKIIAGLYRVQVDEIELGVAAAVNIHLPRLVKETR